MSETWWNIPRMWPDKAVFVIGGGPSIEKEDLTPLHKRHVIGVNNAYQLGEWVDIVFFGDARFYNWNTNALLNFPNRIIHCCKPLNKPEFPFEYLEKISAGPETKQPYPIVWHSKKIARHVNKGGNTGASGISLASKLGAQHIILVGVDMKMKEDRHNFHNTHQHTPKDDVYRKFTAHFESLAEETKRLGIRVVNATPDSNLNVFEKKDLASAINE